MVVCFRFSLPKGCQMEPGGTHKLCKRSVDATNVDFAFLTVITILNSLFYLAGRRWNHEKGHWNQPLNFRVFFGTHFCEKPSKRHPRRLPAGPHFLLFLMFYGPWASKGASCDLLGSPGMVSAAKPKLPKPNVGVFSATGLDCSMRAAGCSPQAP